MVEKPMNEQQVTDEQAMEKKKTLEGGREFNVWKREKRQNKELNEPKVNWGEFELCLKYGRRWKEHTRKARSQTSKSKPTKDAKSERTRSRTDSGEQSQSPDGGFEPVPEKDNHEEGASGIERATNPRVDGPSNSVPVEDLQVTSASRSGTAKDFQEGGASQSERLKDTQVKSPSESAPVQDGLGGATVKESHTNNAEHSAPNAEAESNAEEYTKNEKELAEKIKARLSEDDYWYHEFLGECYIHGMMDGEAMAYQNNNGVRAQVFEFR
jgi:hypothetical protein